MGVQIRHGDCREILRSLPDASVHCCVTSPPYFGLRDYGVAGQIGLEPTPDEYVAQMVAVFREARRALRDDATLWLNLGDSYNSGGNTPGEDKIRRSTLQGGKSTQANSRRSFAAGLKPKDLIGIPWRVAFALQADGWWLRQDIIWSKPNPMPESARDRCTKAHEYIFLLSKSARYYYDADAIAEKSGDWPNHDSRPKGSFNGKDPRAFRAITETRNKRSVWEVATQPYIEAHFATFPPALIEPCILAGCPKGGTVLDPFGGAGTTGLVSDRLQRNAILIELNPGYADMARDRLADDAGMFAEVG
jgi:DNA modification methylase